MGLATVIIKAEGKPPRSCPSRFHLGLLHTILDERLGIFFGNYKKGQD